MVFQDLFYATDQSLLLDLTICLRTVPAIINGRGAA
jgi:lipopolysaccharide/colanic/teichoic acid biosynthesis glycosyltransferase